MSIILGIDPGSRITGFGLVEKSHGQVRYISSGCVRITSTSLSEKLYTIFDGISQLMQEFSPDEVGIESIFMHRNAMSALKLGQARGVAIAAAAHYAVDVFEYSPREIKQAVVGYGAAEKAQVQSMVCRLLSLKSAPQPDAADALAVALCHIHTQEGKARLAASETSLQSSKKLYSQQLDFRREKNQYEHRSFHLVNEDANEVFDEAENLSARSLI